MNMPATIQTKRPYLDWALAGLCAVLVLALFHYLGQRPAKAVDGQSALTWIYYQWVSGDGDFSHGWLMPLITFYGIWIKRDDIATAPKRTNPYGALVVAGALLIHIAAYRIQQPRISLVAMVFLLWGSVLFAYGWQVARHLLFPAGYMLLAFASFWLIAITFKLRLMACFIAELVLNGIGIETVRQGTILQSAAGGGFTFNVADPCSGLRSLVVMTALAAPFAYLSTLSTPRKWVLFLSSIPLAVLANIMRIVSIALLAEVAGQEFAMRVFHDFSGFLVFFIATLLLVATSQMLKPKPQEGGTPSDSNLNTPS